MKSIINSSCGDVLRLTAIILLLFILPGTRSFAQSYQEVKTQKEQYLEILHQSTPDSLFYHEGSEYNKFKQWVEFWEPRLFPNGDFKNYYAQQKAGLEQINESPLTIYPADWQEIGPTDEPSGTIPCNVTQSAGIGPVEFIRFYKPNPQHLFTASTKGGLFYSGNGGDNWVNAGSDLWSGISPVSWAEFKVNDPEVAYAASGQPDDNHAGEIQWTGGIYRVQKNGPINPNTQWDRIADVSNCFNGQLNCRINKVLTDPYDPDVLYVATTYGLFKSSNVNAATPTWLNVLADNVWDVEIRPGAGNHLTLYASFDGNPNLPNPSPNSNLVKFSTNGGNTWNVLPGSPSSLPINTASNISSISIEVSEIAGLQQNIYLLYYGTNSLSKNIYRYDFSNSSFVNILTNVDDITLGCFSNCCFGSGYGFGISQSGPNEVIFLAYGDRYARLLNGNLTLFGCGHPNVNEYHVDVEGFTFNPNNANEVWMASHGGPYKSTNQGDNWVPKMKGVGVAMVFNMATSYENPEDILISTYHDGDMLTQGSYTPNWNPAWKYVFGCDGANVLIDNKDPNYMYASGQGHPWGRSTDGGATTPFPTIPFYQAGAWSNFSAELNKEETNIIYGIKNNEVNRDFNHGASSGTVISNLDALSTGNPTNSNVVNIFTFDHNKDLLLATYYNSTTTSIDLYYTLKARDPAINSISDWFKVNLGNNPTNISEVEIDPLNPTTIYVTLYPNWSGSSINIINKVENFTTTPIITDLTYNLPNTTLGHDCLVMEKGSNGGMYLATDIGAMFYTNNSLIAAGPGNAWVQFGSDYPHVTTNGLEINYKVNKIRAAPYARGVWEADLYCPPAPYICTNCTTANGFFWEGTYVSVSETTLNSGRVIMRGTEYVELLPGSGFTLLDPSGNPNNYYEAYIHGCTAAQGNTIKLRPVGKEDESTVSSDRTASPGTQFTVYPNPNSGSFTLRIDSESENDILVFDLMGKLVFQKMKTNEPSHVINLSGFPKGIYLVQVTSGTRSMVKRVVTE